MVEYARIGWGEVAQEDVGRRVDQQQSRLILGAETVHVDAGRIVRFGLVAAARAVKEVAP